MWPIAPRSLCFLKTIVLGSLHSIGSWTKKVLSQDTLNSETVSIRLEYWIIEKVEVEHVAFKTDIN